VVRRFCFFVIPAKAGIHFSFFVIPAKAGIHFSFFVIPAKAGIHSSFFSKKSVVISVHPWFAVFVFLFLSFPRKRESIFFLFLSFPRKRESIFLLFTINCFRVLSRVS